MRNFTQTAPLRGRATRVMGDLIQRAGRKFRPLLRSLLAHLLPRPLRLKAYRRLVKLSFDAPEGIVFKVAETREELTQAFQLLHRNYVKEGYMDPHPSGMRILKYFALPSTTTLIAKKGEKVVGTISHIRAGAFGLPCEAAYDLSFLKRQRARIAEASALCVDPEYTHLQGRILWPLLKFQNEYVSRYFGIDHVVIVVVPKWFEFYEAFLFFQPFREGRVKYGPAKGVRAQGGFLNLRHCRTRMELAFGDQPRERNLYRYAHELSLECFHFPRRDYATVTDPVMTPELLDYFFRQKSDVFERLTDAERRALHQVYSEERYQAVLPPISAESVLAARKARHEVGCGARLFVPGSSPVDVKVTNASLQGVGGIMHRKLRLNDEYSMEVEISNHEVSVLRVAVTWMSEDGACGFQIVQAADSWRIFHQAIENSLYHRQAA